MPSATTYSAASKSSKFIRLNDFCLAEYIFYQYDKDPVNNHNQEPDDCHFFHLENGIANINQIYNGNVDGQDDSQKTFYITNNIKKYLAVPYNGNRYYKFEENNNIFLNDPDQDYFEEFYVGKDEYATVSTYLDTVRFHFISGYQTSAHDALVFGVKIKQNSTKYNTFLSTWFTPENYSNLVVFNPHPIYISDEIYDRYVDYRIPSISYINNRYYRGGDTTLGTSLSDGSGFVDQCPIVISLDVCDGTVTRDTTTDKFTFYDVSSHYDASISQFNEYDIIEATINESSEGNFFEYGLKTSDGTSVTDWFNRLNGRGDKWTFVHQLNVYEHTKYGDEISSDTVTTYQTDNFDTLSKYRPVLDRAAVDVMMTIEYMCRIVNESTGEQILRNTSTASYNVSAYGKNTLGIGGLHGLAPYKIYNRLFKTNLSQSELYEEPSIDINNDYYMESESGDVHITKVQYPVYIDRNCVCANDDIITSESVSDNRIIYKQYDLWILLDTMDNVLRFTIYKNSNGSLVPYDLTDNSAGIYYKLIFNIDNTVTMTIDAATTESYNLADGEIIFEVSSNEAKQILESSTNDFYISAYNYSTMKNYPLYKGFWISSSKYDDYKAHVEKIREEYDILSKNSKKLDEISDNIESPLDDIPGDVYIPGYVDVSTQDDMAGARSSTPNEKLNNKD